jgi:hypothetical protein
MSELERLKRIAETPQTVWTHQTIQGVPTSEVILSLVAMVEAAQEDAEKYRWLRATLEGAKCGGGVEVNSDLQVYEKPEPGEEVRIYWYQETPVGFYHVEAATLDEAVTEGMKFFDTVAKKER